LGVCIGSGVAAYFAGLSFSASNILLRMSLRGALAVMTYALMVFTFDPNLRGLVRSMLQKTSPHPEY
jgi:hypothetical protein